MNGVQELRCKTCDAVLDLSTAIDGVIQCAFCKNKYTVPKEEAKSDTRELLAIAEHELDTCTFDRAYTAYKKAADTDASEPEAYFGMALADFKVQYLKDAAKKHLQPICHDINDRKFSEDKNYIKAVSLATAAQKKVYAARAEEIDSVAKEFNRLKDSGISYDCFICVKVSDKDAKGNKINTQDSYEALKLYNHLKKRGYSPFYSEEEIRGKAGAAYEATILYALYTSECMLVVCSNEEYLQTDWVKNEYTRFMELINDERKDADSITIVFNGKPIERLPGKRALIQGVNLGSGDAYTTIEDFVESHTPEAKRRRQEEAAAKARQEEEIRRQLEEQKEAFDKAQRELEEKLKNIQTQTVAAPSVGSAASATVQSLLIRAKQEKKDGNNDRARDYYNKVIDADPQNAEAWWGMFLLDMNAPDSKSLASRIDDKLFAAVTANRNYRNACEYATGAIKTETDKFNEELQDPKKWYARFLRTMGGKNNEEALQNMTAAKVSLVRTSPNLALAKRFATPEIQKLIDNMLDRVDSSDTYFQLFLENFAVKSEEKLLADITEELKDEIENNENYKLALKKQGKASPEYAKRISDFYDKLHGAETEWKLFLSEHGLSSEDEYFNSYDELMCDLDDDEHYQNTMKGLDGAPKALVDRVNKFNEKLFGAETAWNILLSEFKVKDSASLAAKVTPNDIENFDNENVYVRVGNWRNEYYQVVKAKATGKLRQVFDEFDMLIHSFEFWHEKILKIMKTDDENYYLENEFSYSKTSDIVNAVNVASAYANAAQKKELDAFLVKLKKQHKAAGSALDSWKAAQKKMGCKSDEEMKNTIYLGNMSDFKETKDALSFAEEAKDNGLTARFLSVIAAQEARVSVAKGAKTRLMLNTLFTAVAIALPVLMVVTAIAGGLGLSPLWEFWTIWYSSVSPTSSWLIAPIMFGLIFAISIIVMKVKRTQKIPFLVMRVLSLVVSCVIFITGFAFLPAGMNGTGFIHVHDRCAELYEENGVGYTLVKFDYNDSSRTSFEIPAEHNGKKVTQIGSGAFRDSSTLTSITIPDGVTRIGSSAFVNCWALESINIPASVRVISSYAFDNCESLKSVVFEDKDGWGASAEDLSDPANAAKFLRETNLKDTWVKPVYAEIENNGLIRCDGDWLKICDVDGRTYIKETGELAYAALVFSNDGYTGPLLVGTTSSSVEYKVGSNLVRAQDSFKYNGKKYYYSYGTYYMHGDHRANDRGIYACENRDLLEAAKEIAALIEELK